MHMEHTFVVSGLVPGILGSLPSPRAEVQAKLASAVTRQRFVRPARTKQEKPSCQLSDGPRRKTGTCRPVSKPLDPWWEEAGVHQTSSH